MKKFTILMLALIACASVMQAKDDPYKERTRSSIYNTLPSGYQQLGDTKIYYSIAERYAAGPGDQYGISILGEIDGRYYSSTYGTVSYDDGCGAGFIAAFKVGNGTATYLNAKTGNTINGVNITARLEPSGEVAARIVYTLTNNNSSAVTVQGGVWADIMIGTNDYAPLSLLKNTDGEAYGLKLKYNTEENTPLMCALFGEGVTGVTAADDYWFGFYRNNYAANDIIGNYDNYYDEWGWEYEDYDYLVENGDYDSGMGFCWKDRTIEAGETIELSYLVSVGEIDFEEPIIEPGEDHFTYSVEAFDIDEWNQYGAAHPAHIWGYYEHPYGQAGYIEYQVDGGEWFRIETPLTSGEDYDLPFVMRFDADEANIHVLALRFTDGLGNYTELEGLSWIDMRSVDIDGIEDRVYTGEPQIFYVTVNGETQVIGTEGEYVEPGEYTARFYGAFEDGTIGVVGVDFIIDKAPCQYTVIVPDDVEYDGEAHGATVIVTAGGEATVYYVNTVTGEILTDDPVEPGIYAVIVSIEETDYYYGLEETSFGEFEIYVNMTGVSELNVNNEDNGAWYTIEGIRVAAPTQSGIYIHNGKKYIVK